MKNIYDMLNDSGQYDGMPERIELTDVEKRKIMDHITGNKKYRTKKAAVAAAFAAVLIAGTSAYAAVKHFGIVDYYANSNVNLPQEEVEKLVDTQVQQELVGSDNKEDSLVDFHIREALCDNNQLVVEVEAVPTDPEHYILAPTDCDLDCPATDLLIDGVTEGTAGEYAAAQGKEILQVEAMIFDGSFISENSMDFVREEDGTLMIVVNTANAVKENIMEISCVTSYVNANDDSAENVVHSEFTFQITDKSNTTQFIYVPDHAVAAEDIGGSVLDEFVVDQTELTTAVTLKWHLTQALSEEEMTEDYAMDFHIYTEDGTKLAFIRDGSVPMLGKQAQDGTWEIERTYVYETIDLPDTLIVKAYDFIKSEEVGEFIVHLKK